MKLFFREYGSGSPLIILHGLFGSSDNWLTQAKILSTQYKVYTVDQRNHGQSPHDEGFDYKAMVADLLEFTADHQIVNPIVLGHSMGGKAAMNFALAHPEKVEKLIVVDIAPKSYDLEHYKILEGLKAIPVKTIASRNEAEDILSDYVKEKDVRLFLLKNLQRKSEGGFSWKINLPVIDQKLSNIGLDLQFSGPFEKPTLFIRGAQSTYVLDEDRAVIKEIFPRSTLVTMDTGHWVQAEKPQEFVDVVLKWLVQ
jgi:pimeloyl-ACP methyl ester carboxylesterase